jgi:hypothetical protein
LKKRTTSMFGAFYMVRAISLIGFKQNPIELTLTPLKLRCQVSSLAGNHTPNPAASPFLKQSISAATARGTCGA